MTQIIPNHGGNIYQESRRLGGKERHLLDASASLVPFPPPKGLRRHLVKALSGDSLRSYPDCTYLRLREAIGNWHKIDPSMVLPGNGAAELLTWAARNASEKGNSTLFDPGFSDYARALSCWNGKFNLMKLPLRWSPEKPQKFPATPTTNVLWITNPHNPTGQLWSRASIEPLIENHDLIICDEAFLSLVPNGESQSLIPLVINNPNLIVIRSLTKLFAIAGLRLGYAIGTAKRLEQWQSWRDPWPLNGLASTAGYWLMNDHQTLNKWTKKIHQWLSREGPWLEASLNHFPGIHSHPSSTNFQLIESKSSLIELREMLSRKNILLRDCRSFESLGENWLRISLQTRKNNMRIISAMEEILNQFG